MRRVLLPLLAAAGVLLATVLVPTGSAGAAGVTDARVLSGATSAGPAFGSQFHGMWASYDDATRERTLDALKAHGVEWVRLDVSWETLNSREGYWSSGGTERVDRVLDMIIARGLKPLVMLWYTPAWAAGPNGSRALPPDPARYAEAATYAATRWRGKVKAWEVWNEQNLEAFNASTDPVEYARLLRAAYPAFKAADPDAAVVFGGVVYNDVDWVRRAYEAGAGGHFDIMATHPYQAIGDLPPESYDGTKWTLRHARAVRELMVERGDGDKPVWFTEFGWSSHANAATEPNWSRGVTLQQQADYAVRALEIMRTEMPWVTAAFWYNERNRTDSSVHLNNYGFLNADLSAKPVATQVRDYLAARDAAAPAPAPAPSDAPGVRVVPCPARVATSEPSVVLCAPTAFTR